MAGRLYTIRKMAGEWTAGLAACVALLIPLHAQSIPTQSDAGGRVEGRVVDSSGLPVAHAIVKLRNRTMSNLIEAVAVTMPRESVLATQEKK